MPPSVPARPYLLERLRDSELAAAYVEAVLKEGDAAALRLALRNVLDARCEASDADKKSRLHRRLSGGTGVGLSDLRMVLAATRFRLSVKAVAA